MCKKTMIRLFSIFVFLPVLFFISCLFFSSNSYAVSDATVTFSNGATISGSIFSDVTISDYDYIIYFCTSTAYTCQSQDFRAVISDYTVSLGPVKSSPSIYKLPSGVSYFRFAQTFVANRDYTFVLTDDLASYLNLGSSCPPSPSGSLDITENGTYDVSSYSSAVVNIPETVIQGDYHDDLLSINKSILVCGAILLVLYFFYCIYRLIIRNSGVK